MVESTRDSVKHFNSLKCFNQSPTSSLFTITSYLEVGGDKRDRTADLLNAIQALSQLSYTPIFGPSKLSAGLALLRQSHAGCDSPPDTTFRFLLPIESPAQRVSIGEEKPICKGVFRLWRNTEFAKRVSTRWWAKMDSNHRPHDYQSCALAS